MRTLVEIMTHGSKEAARVAAAEALLNRGWGRPEQVTTIAGFEGGPLEIVLTHADD